MDSTTLALKTLLGFLAFNFATANGDVSTQMAKLVANDGGAGDHFGISVAISGDTAVVGAYDDDDGSDSGSAYVFVQNGTGWVQMAKLVANDGAADDYFGRSVAISGDTAVVGAPYDDDKGIYSGSAYVFVCDGTGCEQMAKLVANDGAFGGLFGISVAISGDTVLVGAHDDDDKGEASGSAYVFTRNGTGWVQTAKLVASDGAANDNFGFSVAISGDTALVGAPNDDAEGTNSGSTYVFVQNGIGWIQMTKLIANDGAAFDYFGRSIDISGDTAVVGADSISSAYVFDRNNSGWEQVAKLMPNDGAANDFFGRSVAISGDTAVVGALSDDDKGPGSGSAYVFARNGTEWVQMDKLLAGDGAEHDNFGWSTAISGNTAVVGAFLHDTDNGNDSGAGYIFDIIPLSAPTNYTSSQNYSNILTKFGFNNATLAANSDSSFNFQFINSITGSTIHAAIIAATPCNTSNSAFQIKDGGNAGAIIGPVVTNSTVATLTRDIESDIDPADKNSGMVVLNYCLRADLYDDAHPSVSVGARKVNLQLEITYENESDFSITSIKTSEFGAIDSSTSATRSVGIKVFKDSCTSGCEIVDGDSNGCFTSEADKAKIGEILALCLKAEDTDVELTGIESASVKAGDTLTSDIVAFDANGIPGSDNFVTATMVANGEVTLKTLLIPSYYDGLDGGANGSLEVSGTVLVEYIELSVRRLRILHLGVGDETRRQLQGENQGDIKKSPFSISIPLENPDKIPKIAEEENESSSADIDIGVDVLVSFACMAILIGGAAPFFFL